MRNGAEHLLSTGDIALDPEFNAVCRDHPWSALARVYTEGLWREFRPYADSKFRTQIRANFHACFFEMYMANCALSHYKVSSADYGPDMFLPELNVWIECIAATNGEEGKADTVPPPNYYNPNDPSTHEADIIPDDLILLRLTHAFQEKANKFLEYRNKGLVRPDQPTIIAVNGAKVHHARLDSGYPRILAAVFPIGREYVSFSVDKVEPIGGGFYFADSVEKANKAPVSKLAFVDARCSHVSALVFSIADVWNRPDKVGRDLVLIPNPFADAPVDPKLFRIGRYTEISITEHRASFTFPEIGGTTSHNSM